MIAALAIRTQISPPDLMATETPILVEMIRILQEHDEEEREQETRDKLRAALR